MFLSEDWLNAFTDRLGSLPPWEGPSHAVQFEVTGGPSGKVTYHVVVPAGGTPKYRPGAADDRGVVITQEWADALAQARGQFDPAVGFMQGHMKVKGSSRPLLDLFSVMADPHYAQAVAALASDTEY